MTESSSHSDWTAQPDLTSACDQGLNNNWQGANFDQAAPIDLGCRIDGNWVENTPAAHQAGGGGCGQADSCFNGEIQAVLVSVSMIRDYGNIRPCTGL